MVLLLIILLILLLLIFILTAPLRITINTDAGIYRANYSNLISIALYNNVKPFRIYVRILFIRFRIRFGKKRTGPEIDKPVKQRKRKSMTLKKAVRLVRTAWASLNIKRLFADIDTGDYPLNAQLIPVAQLASRENVALCINFEDRNQLDLVVQTRVISLLWHYIRFGTSNK